LRAIAAAIPVTYSIQGLRAALLENGSLQPALAPIAALAVSALVLLPFSVLLFSLVIRRARLLGTLSFY
jgi:hypothetical protein